MKVKELLSEQKSAPPIAADVKNQLKLTALLESREGIPVSQDALNDELPLMEYVETIRSEIKKNKPESKIIDVRKLADAGKLMSTQSNTEDEEADEPVFPQLKLPVIFEDSTGYIMDGHRRLTKAYKSHQTAEVFLV